MRLAVVALMAGLSFSSCLKNGDDTLVIPLPDGKIPTSVISADLQDSLRSNGFIIYEGITPDIINGKFRAEPLILHYASDNYMNNFYPLTMTLTEQKPRGMIKYAETQRRDTVEGTAIAAQVIGHDSCFTMYCWQNLADLSEPNIDSVKLWECKIATVISGIVTPTGFKNFQYAYIMLEKKAQSEYYYNALADINTFRIYYDGDSLARKIPGLN